MPLEGERSILAKFTIISIQQFATSLSNIGGTQIRGLNKFINDLKTGKPLGDSKARFYQNVLLSISAVKTPYTENLGKTLLETIEHAIGKMERYYSDIISDNPVEYLLKRILLPDPIVIDRLNTDVNASFRRISELMKLENKSLSLPALKDQYILAFETIYKTVRARLYSQLDDGNITRTELNKRLEDILCMEQCYATPKGPKSDIRIIRNLFAHPDRIDYLDYYQICVDGKTVQKLYPNDLLNLIDRVTTNLMLVTYISEVIIHLEMYRRVFG